MSTTTTVKEFKCIDCGKICKTSAALKLHNKSHDDMHKKSDELQKVIKEEHNKSNKEIELLKNQIIELLKENKECKDKIQSISKLVKDCTEILQD